MNNTIELLTALGVGGVVTRLTSYLISRHKELRAKKKSFGTIFASVHEVYSILNVMLAETDAHRVLILKLTNGGGKPKPGGQLYSSVVYEVFEEPLGGIRRKWQQQRVDEAYVNMMLDVDRDGHAWAVTEAMQDGILKDLYEASNIKKGLAIKIAEKETEYIYLVMNFTENVDETAQFKELMREGLNRLRAIFNSITFR